MAPKDQSTVAGEPLVHANVAINRSMTDRGGTVPCGQPRTRGLPVSGDPNAITCDKCRAGK